MPIPEIFASEGESGFRRREREMIGSLATRRNCVISTGGGAMLEPENIRNLRTGAVIVCLRAEPDTILERIGADAYRPLLQGPDRLARIRELLEQRASAYEHADFFVETSESDIEEVVDRIVRYFPPERVRTTTAGR